MLKLTKKTEKGFTLILVMLVTGAVLSVSFGVFGLVLKELQLASVGRESQIAFYAADSGIECAFYWDIETSGDMFITPPYPLVCAGSATAITPVEVPSGSGIFWSDFQRMYPDGSCVDVIIKKDTVISAPSVLNVVTANGYNMACDSDDSRKVERTLRSTYEYSF